jgi:hypothetical protein
MSELLPEERSSGSGVSPALVAVAAVSAVVGLALMASAFAVLAWGSDSASIAEAEESLRDAGCTVEAYPATGKPVHFEDLNTKVKYNSYPPTNGDHYYVPTPWGRYLTPVNPRQLVHNLEHGGIAIQYGARVTDESFDRIRNFYREDRQGIILAPLDALGQRVALTAWVVGPEVPAKDTRLGAGYVALCPDFDEDAFADFRSAFRYRGPESCSRLSEADRQAGRPCYEPEGLEPGF